MRKNIIIKATLLSLALNASAVTGANADQELCKVRGEHFYIIDEKAIKAMTDTVNNLIENGAGATLRMGAAAVGVGITGLVLWRLTNSIYNYMVRVDMAAESNPGFFRNIWNRVTGVRHPALEELTFAPETKRELFDYRDMLHFANQNKETLPNLLLYGPPGTGKTEAAKRMARSMGMNYKFMSGSDVVGKMDPALAIQQLESLFAEKNTLIFIDEIENLLEDRQGVRARSDGHTLDILNKFLSYTGTRSKDYCVIGATNIPSVLDEAVRRRFDFAIKLDIPGSDERKEIIRKCLLDELGITAKKKRRPAIAGEFLNQNYFDEMAEKTVGLSGGELKDLCHHAAMFAKMSRDYTFQKDMMDRTIEQMAKKKDLFEKK